MSAEVVHLVTRGARRAANLFAADAFASAAEVVAEQRHKLKNGAPIHEVTWALLKLEFLLGDAAAMMRNEANR